MSGIDFDDRHLFLADDRLSTFGRWNFKNKLSKEMMSQAGFYKIKSKEHTDLVQCVFCKVQIYNWRTIGDPFKEHIKQSPKCPIAQKQIPEDELQVCEWFSGITYRMELELIEKHENARKILIEKKKKLEDIIEKLKEY